MYAYLGRQPLYNKDFVLYGYDILHRDNVTKNLKAVTEEDDELRSVFSDAITLFDFEDLTGGLPAHLRFTYNLLMSNYPYMASPETVVVELPADISVTPALTDKIHELHNYGYKIAVSGYNITTATVKLNKIIQYADFVYINVHKHNRLQILDLIKRVRDLSRAKLLAEQVDTEADFDKVKTMNFTYFQGLLFGMPNVFRNEVNVGITPFGKLYNELSRSGGNFESCCRLIAAEPVLTFMFLERMPTPKEMRDVEVDIRQSMVMVGTERLRQWSCLLMLKQLSVADGMELSFKAYKRGRFMERLLEEMKTKEVEPTMGFYLGTFSLMDQILDTPLENLFTQVRMEAEVKDVLLKRKDGLLMDVLRFAEGYEETGAPPAQPKLPLDKKEREYADWFRSANTLTELAFSRINPFLPPKPQAKKPKR